MVLPHVSSEYITTPTRALRSYCTFGVRPLYPRAKKGRAGGNFPDETVQLRLERREKSKSDGSAFRGATISFAKRTVDSASGQSVISAHFLTCFALRICVRRRAGVNRLSMWLSLSPHAAPRQLERDERRGGGHTRERQRVPTSSNEA